MKNICCRIFYCKKYWRNLTAEVLRFTSSVFAAEVLMQKKYWRTFAAEVLV